MNELLEALNRAFEEFKASNDARLKQIEAKGHADPLVEAKVDTINAAISDLEKKIQARMDEIEAKANRPGAGLSAKDKEDAAYAIAFNAFARRGDIQAALSTSSDPDGGYAVPIEVDRSILELERNAVTMRRLAQVMTMSTPNYTKLVNKQGATSGWVGETDARGETVTPVLAALTPYWGELYANPAATQQMLDDGFFDVESWLANELSLEFALQENDKFISGDGIKCPKGILAYAVATTADKTRAFGTLQYVKSGAAADFAAATASVSGADALIDMIQSLKVGYRPGSAFVMNSLTVGKVRKFKDLEGNYIWKPGVTEGQPATLLGYRCEEDEAMPDVAANAFPVMFGNFKRGYCICDRIGTRVLRDPYSNKPYVHFYTTKRVGGFLTDSRAIKLLKMEA